jgi:hypothetical protein
VSCAMSFKIREGDLQAHQKDIAIFNEIVA